MPSVEINERVFQGRVLRWIDQIISQEDLPFDGADQEVTIRKDGEEWSFPDIVLWEDREKEKVACLISLKRPPFNGYALELVDEVRSKADDVGARFFATWNVNHFVLWETFEEGTHPRDRRRWHDKVTDIKSIDKVERKNVEKEVKLFLRKFLDRFTDIYYVEKKLPTLPLDKIFRDMLKARIDTFSILLSEKVRKKFSSEKKFQKNLVEWFTKQGWIWEGKVEDFDRVARQYVYLLINKILFYNVIRADLQEELPKIQISEEVSGEQFRNILQTYFDEVEGYKTIFSTDFIDTISPPDKLVGQLTDFIDELNLYDFSEIDYEIIGRIFEQLIPELERHKLGQYFTNSNVVDLITAFCLRHPDDKVLDPGCGAGTFLIRSYMRKKFLDPSKTHSEILKELWGIDIAKFPAHLTIINLIIRNLSSEENYPRVINKDFFDIIPKGEVSLLSRNYETESLDEGKFEKEMPKFDAVIGNPPYTRREEMEDLLPEGYTEKLQNLVSNEWGVDKEGWLSLYGYFFLHGGKFLKEGGREGLITSISWLDVDYGASLQEVFLQNFKIEAIIGSKVERWFREAAINTCVTILERCKVEQERKENLVRFVQLKKPLADFFVTETSNVKKKRWEKVKELTNFIKSKKDFYEDEDIKVFTKNQGELLQEGREEEEYTGGNWGKYVRTPNIYFKIVKSYGEKLTLLNDIADIELGMTTGYNDFFYLKEEELDKWEIEPEFIEPLVKSPKECKSTRVSKDNLKLKVFMVAKDKEELEGTNALEYIRWGEEQGIPERPFFESKSKEDWYKLSPKRDPILLPNLFWKAHRISYNKEHYAIDKKLIGVEPPKKYEKALCALLNSTLEVLFRESLGRTPLGEGALDISTNDYRELLIPDLRKMEKEKIRELEEKMKKISKREIGSVFEEIGAKREENVKLDQVEPDRREIDKIVFDYLGLSEEEQLRVYKAVVSMVKARIEKPKSVEEKGKTEGIDIEALATNILDRIEKEKLRSFPEDYVKTEEYKKVTAPRGKAEVKSDLHGAYVAVGGEEIRCDSVQEAKYIEYAIMNGKEEIKIPKDEKAVAKAVKEYSSILDKIREEMKNLLQYRIPDKKVRRKVKNKLWKKLLQEG